MGKTTGRQQNQLHIWHVHMTGDTEHEYLMTVQQFQTDSFFFFFLLSSLSLILYVAGSYGGSVKEKFMIYSRP